MFSFNQESNDFSNYQLKRLLKRRNVQECLEQAEKEMGGKTMTLEELDQLLTEQGIATTTHEKSSRIAGDNSTRFIYINGIHCAFCSIEMIALLECS